RLTQRVIKGIVKGCMLADCILLGGETAEMPQCYKSGEYDLAGFSVGVVEKNKIINGSRIKPGDLIVGLESSGLHSNGFSLVQKVFSRKELKKLSNELLKPTKLYVKTLLPFINPGHSPSIIKGLVHITGGGLVDNLPRILPLNCQAVIYKDEWEVPDIFCSIREKGKVSEGEMFRVFNMGIGMVLIIPQKHGDLILKNIKKSHLIGKIVAGRRGVRLK
ncbi:phosphoribosylformylglycinamidine cyclo-ligase, partial [bacterium]|nr:phosphoribosylformylglycinamidine cyclo-ligase [bacterium]